MYPLAAADTIQAVAGTATAITYTIGGMEYSVALGEVYKIEAQGQVGISAAAIYTVPASTFALLSVLNFTNTTSNTVTLILYRGGTAAANQISGLIQIPGNGTATIGQDGQLRVTDQFGNTAVSTLAASVGNAEMVAASAGINSSETILCSAVIPANYLTAGMAFRGVAGGVCTSSAANASNFRLRLGVNGTSADAILAAVVPTAAASGTAIPFLARLRGVIRTIGSSGTMIGGGELINNGVTGVSAATPVANQAVATTAVNTTVQNILSLSYVAAASTTTCTFHQAGTNPD